MAHDKVTRTVTVLSSLALHELRNGTKSIEDFYAEDGRGSGRLRSDLPKEYVTVYEYTANNINLRDWLDREKQLRDKNP